MKDNFTTILASTLIRQLTCIHGYQYNPMYETLSGEMWQCRLNE